MARNLSIVGLALFVGMVFAEILLRQLPETTLGFRFESGRFKPPREFVLDKTHNRFGFHDVELTSKPERTRRVVLLGDSFVAGLAVSIPQTVTRRVAHHLLDAGLAAYDVLAIASPGIGPKVELKALVELGPEFEPDIVISVLFSGNDIADSLDPLDRRELLAGGAALRPYDGGPARYSTEEARYLFASWSVLNQLVSQRLTVAARKRSYRGIPLNYLVYADEPADTWERAWANTEQILVETRNTAAELGASYAVVSIPSAEAVLGEAGKQQLIESYPDMKGRPWDFDLPDRRLAAICERHDIPFLALRPAFRRHIEGGGPPAYWKYDAHWTALGHDLAGSEIARLIARLEARR